MQATAVKPPAAAARVYAIRRNNYKGYCALIEGNADFKATNLEGYSLVHVAATVKGHSTLLALTYDDHRLHEAAPDGNTPLHLAMMSNNLYAINVLLPFATPESILTPNAAGQNILDLARQLDDKKVLELVLMGRSV